MRIIPTLRGFLIGAGVSGVIVSATASSSAQTSSALETTYSVRRSLERLPYYGVFDYMTFGVDRGVVTLNGYAYSGSLKTAAEIAARRSAGVDEVANRLELLPASPNDDRIRWVAFYKIYTDAFLSRYASGGEWGVRRELIEARRFNGMYQPLGLYAIHIVVRNGHVSLFGVVDSDADKQIAEVRAREVSGVFGVENEIVVAKKVAAK
jgi:hyperosmotically inducible periplasmic protein